MTEIIREFMMEVMDGYEEQKKNSLSKSTLAWKIQSGFPQKLRELVFPGDISYSIRGWTGPGTWTENPYVMIRHRAVSNRGGNDMSIMYIFSADMKCCYLALMLPWEEMDVGDLSREAGVSRNMMWSYNNSLSFEVMDLRTESELANRLEEACVFCCRYTRNNLPRETELRKDLMSVLALYENYIRINKFGITRSVSKNGPVNRIYIKYRLGNPSVHCHCEAIHADSDSYTQQLVEDICKYSGCSGIISTASSRKYDLNRPANPRSMDAVYEYRDTIRRILQHLEILSPDNQVTVPFLHIAFHAIKNDDTNSSEIRVSYEEPASASIANWFGNKLKEKTGNITGFGGSPVRVNLQFVDEKSRQFRRYGEKGNIYNGDNKAYHFLLVEISEDLRCMSMKPLARSFNEVIREFTMEFAPIDSWYKRDIG